MAPSSSREAKYSAKNSSRSALSDGGEAAYGAADWLANVTPSADSASACTSRARHSATYHSMRSAWLVRGSGVGAAGGGGTAPAVRIASRAAHTSRRTRRASRSASFTALFHTATEYPCVSTAMRSPESWASATLTAMWRRPHLRRSATSSTGQWRSSGTSPRARAGPTSARDEGGKPALAHRIASQSRSPDMCRGWAMRGNKCADSMFPPAAAPNASCAGSHSRPQL